MTRTNLVTNPSFETNATGWTVNIGTLARDAAPAWSFSGTSALKLDVTTATTVDVSGQGGTNPGFPATADLPYSISAYVRSSTTTSVRFYTRFWDSAGNLLESTFVAAIGLTANTPTRLTRDNRVAPAGTAYVSLFIRFISPSVGTVILLDGIMAEQATATGDYFDGSTAQAGFTHAWAGTAHASTSTQTASDTRVNLVKNPSFETDLTYWVSNPAAKYAPLPLFARNTTQASTGTACLEAVAEIKPGSTNVWFIRYGISEAGAKNADAMPITAGQTATVSHYSRASTTPAILYTGITFFDAAGAVTGTPVGGSYNPQTTFTRRSFSAVAPTGTTSFGFSIGQTSSGLNGFYFDGFQAEVGALGDYFDGSTTPPAGYTNAWTGTAHSSTSTSTEITTRTNLLPNPSFETGAAGWNLVGTGTVGFGTASNANPFSYSGICYGNGAGPWISDKLPATAGLPYTASAWWNRGVGARSGGVFIHFYDAGGAELSPPSVSESAITTAFTPQRFSSTRTAPEGTAQVAVRLQAGTITSVDSVMLEQSPNLGPYFDGSTRSTTLTHGWTGTPHASPSTQTAGAPTDGTLVTLKVREGDAWVSRPAVPRYRTNGTWLVGNPKRWNGTAWVDLN